MAAQFGYRFSAGDFPPAHTDEFREATFEVRDLRGARFVDCDFSGVRAVSGTFADVELSGWVQHLVVNGVDVTGYVEAELDRRHPERVQLRNLQGPDDFRAMWATIGTLWYDLADRVAGSPDGTAEARVDGEWSYAQTLRHLIWVTDGWAARTILDQERPYHRLGLPQDWFPSSDAGALGIAVDSEPSLEEIVEARTIRMAQIQDIVDGLSGAELGRAVTRTPGPHYPDEPRTVAECLWVVMEEECDHYRYAVRDLDRLAALQAAE